MFLPLTNNPEETFTIKILDTVYNLRQLWNTVGFWTLDIKDVDGIVIIAGVKIITQDFILKQFPDIPFDLYSDNQIDPGREDLSTFLLEVIEKDV